MKQNESIKIIGLIGSFFHQVKKRTNCNQSSGFTINLDRHIFSKEKEINTVNKLLAQFLTL